MVNKKNAALITNEFSVDWTVGCCGNFEKVCYFIVIQVIIVITILSVTGQEAGSVHKTSKTINRLFLWLSTYICSDIFFLGFL